MSDLIYYWTDGYSKGGDMHELERNHAIDFHLVLDFTGDSFGSKCDPVRPRKGNENAIGGSF
jgi:hypothetical protein